MALEEPEEFLKNVRSTNQAVRKLPVAELFREQSKQVALATGATIAIFGLFYFAIVYLASYGTQVLKLGKTEVLLIGMAGAVSLAIATMGDVPEPVESMS